MDNTSTGCDSNTTRMSHVQRPNDRLHFPRINASDVHISPYLFGDRSSMALNFPLSPHGQPESTQQQSSSLIACETPANVFSCSRAEGSSSSLIATGPLPDHAIRPRPHTKQLAHPIADEVSWYDRSFIAAPSFTVATATELCAPAKRKPCMRCSTLRQKCESDPSGNLRCTKCERFDIPIHVCFAEPINRYKPFEKWTNEVYEVNFTVVRVVHTNLPRTAILQHYLDGPKIALDCQHFVPTSENQTRILRKDANGWRWHPTSPFCLTQTELDIGHYVRKCILFSLKEGRESQNQLTPLLTLAVAFRKERIIWQCLELYTTLRLMRIGWKFAGDEALEMSVIDDQDSPWHGMRPVPRMVQNQLDHLLELHIIALDKAIIREVNILLRKRERSKWLITILAIFFLLHVREVDGARNIYWKRWSDPAGFWIHPSKPGSIIGETVASCNALLAKFHCSIGTKPLTLNWDHQSSWKLVQEDRHMIRGMKFLQQYISILKRDGQIGRKACDLYKAGDPNSVDLTISSLLFSSVASDWDIKGFS